MTETRQLASRVFRLEAHLLDQELDETVDRVIDHIEIPRFGEELKALLKTYLFSGYLKTSGTAGMSVYDLKYSDASYLLQDNLPRYKLVAMFALNLTASHIMKRCRTIESSIQKSFIGRLNLPWLNLDKLTLLVKSLSIINFFLFLRHGKYLSLPERLLDIVPTVSNEGHYNSTQLARVQMDFMYREVVWKAIAEFLTTVIPMVNVEQLKNRLLNLLGMDMGMQSDLDLSEKFKRDDKGCAICLKQPFNPYEIGCRHIFCYYCLQSRYLSDQSIGYSCKLCNYKTEDLSIVRRYKPLIVNHSNFMTTN